MKKLISMIMIISFVFALCACSGENKTLVVHDDHDHTHVAETTTIADTDVTTTEGVEVPTNENSEPIIPGVNDNDTDATIHPVDTKGQYKENYIKEIDNPCAEELMKAQSDASKIVIYNTYSEEWAEVGERFNTELLKIKGTVPATENFSTDAQMHEYLEFCMQEWEALLTEKTATFEAMMIEGADNTAYELMIAQIRYEINREYALYFIDMYEEIEDFSNQGN